LLSTIGRYLYDKGFDVYGVRLAGHGTSPEDLAKTKWQEWLESADIAYQNLQTKYSTIYISGGSMGALIALNLMTKYPIPKAVLISPFIIPTAKRFYFLPILRYFIDDYIYTDIRADRLHMMYTRNPVASSIQLGKLVKHTKKILPKVKSELLILHSPKDDVADPKSVDYILKHVSSKRKNVIWAGDEHTFLIDYDEVNYKIIADFLMIN